MAARSQGRDSNQTTKHVDLLEDGLRTRVQIPPAPPYAGGQIFSVPLFHARKALFLRASASFLVDVVCQISLFFILREHISLFFLSWLVDVSMSRTQY